MTEREKEVFDLINSNPLISQEEISEKLKIARSSVAVHISNLMKKGYVLGKGYILKEAPYIAVIGGANIDIEGVPLGVLKMKDSNPGVVNKTFGGVAKNIAENISKLGIDTKLITLVGGDSHGKDLIDYCRKKGIDTSYSTMLERESTSIYISILDEDRDMAVAISHMDIMTKMDIPFIKKRTSVIKGAVLCVVDTNIPLETLEYLLKHFKETKFIVDTVSLEKSKKLKNLLPYIDTLKPNKIEAEILSGIKISTREDTKNAAEIIIKKGVKNIFLSLGKEGVYYSNGTEMGFIETPEITVTTSTGAGDAFLAGVTYGKSERKNIKKQVMYGVSASISVLTNSKIKENDIDIDRINEILKEVKKCNSMKNI
ncbi:PfkB family carbohydrate kinase [uncultured Ilyobacter sp.]|uniref:PfkB family carbohydrate kinase n=1 Tax=uncultured Ilyobacter sp. TaxID=544433 RepID=UPI0029C7759C|nr:PfkB family carbohydrate kinase [uncultured Ilyobacter sp.]